MAPNKNYFARFLIYYLLGILFLSITGTGFAKCVGFGIIAGFVFGLLNEIHADLLEIKSILKGEEKENDSKD